MAYQGEPVYTPRLGEHGQWEIGVTAFSVGNQARVDTTIPAIVDTGSTFISLADSAIVKQYYDSFGARWGEREEAWIFNCDAEVPDFSFWLGDHPITIPGSIMNRGGLFDEDDTFCSGGLTDHESNKPLIPHEDDEDPPYHIIGMAALEALYVIFDATENAERIGFAYKAPVAEAPQTMLADDVQMHDD